MFFISRIVTILFVSELRSPSGFVSYSFVCFRLDDDVGDGGFFQFIRVIMQSEFSARN